MRSLYTKLTVILGLLMVTVSCSDEEDTTPRVIPTMSMTVSDIVEKTATLNSEQLTGTTYGAKVLNYYPVANLEFDYNTEVKLVKFVEENGEPVSLPYEYKITSGLRPGVSYISAIIAYNEKGRAVCSAFQVWTASGTVGTWTEDSSAGNLDEKQW